MDIVSFILHCIKNYVILFLKQFFHFTPKHIKYHILSQSITNTKYSHQTHNREREEGMRTLQGALELSQQQTLELERQKSRLLEKEGELVERLSETQRQLEESAEQLRRSRKEGRQRQQEAQQAAEEQELKAFSLA